MTCNLEYMPTRDQAFCKTHQKLEVDCLRAEVNALRLALAEHHHNANCMCERWGVLQDKPETSGE